MQPLKEGMCTYSNTLFSFPSKPIPLPAHTLMSRIGCWREVSLEEEPKMSLPKALVISRR